jgi:imidazolonepropionase
MFIQDESIVAVGPSAELIENYPNEAKIDASDCVVMPGFVDPHTHLVWAGDRAAEFEMRLEGKSYLEILAAGGGILSTVQATRDASLDTLLAEARPRLQTMLEYGTTTAEAKTGYGLETESELRMLEALLALDGESVIDLAITFLGVQRRSPSLHQLSMRKDVTHSSRLVA